MSEEVTTIKVNVQLSQNKREAFVTLVPDKWGGPLSAVTITDALDRNNVVFGLDKQAIEKLVAHPVFSSPVQVARGVDSIPGDDAEIKYLFEKNVEYTPKLREDGSVDFKDLGLIQKVRKGDLLAIKKPRTDGTPGTDVCGQPMHPNPARDYPIPAGRNVVFSGDKLKLFAETDGQVVYHNDRVSVLNTYTVDGDVSTATGNIDFNGNVVVKGNVKTGFSVKAAGDVEVGGIVEAAEIEAGGDIIIRNGFNGGGNGKLTAEGCIMSKFIQQGVVLAHRKIETNYIYNSNVRSRDVISVVGKGIVIGGHICARTRIDAGTLGNESFTKTIVEAGADPETVARNQELIAEIDSCKKNIKAIDSAVSMLNQLKEAGKLPEEKVPHLEKSMMILEKLTTSLEALEVEKERIDLQLEMLGKGYIGIRGIAYPGVTIKMGSEMMPLKGKYQHTLFSRNEGYIKSGPL